MMEGSEEKSGEPTVPMDVQKTDQLLIGFVWFCMVL